MNIFSATASAWAHYGFDYADWFDTARGRALFTPLHAFCRGLRPVAPTLGAFTDSLYWRHYWFSTWTERQAPALAVEIGAGLSTRGIAYAERHRDAVWVDYDLPDLAAARRRLIGDRPLPANYRLAAGDLLDTRLGAELAAPESGPTVVLTEGVVDYLDSNEKRHAWTNVAQLLERLGGGRYLLEVHPRAYLMRFGVAARVMLAALQRITGRDIQAQLFDTPDTALRLLRDCGFRRARELPEAELADADRALAPERRAFALLEAEI